MEKNNKFYVIIIGSVLLLYNKVAIITCINKHKYIRDSYIIKLTDYLKIGLKKNKIKSIYYVLYISLSKLKVLEFAFKYVFASIISSFIKVRLKKGISLFI